MNKTTPRIWILYYETLKKYYKKNKNILVPKGYMLDGMDLFAWLNSQRDSYKKNMLNTTQIDLLESLDIIWKKTEASWQMKYELAKVYYMKNDHLQIPRNYKVYEVNLGRWINSLRCSFANKKLSEQRVDALNKIGMIWDAREHKNPKLQLYYEEKWNNSYELAKEFYKKEGHLLIPRGYSVGKQNVGRWIKTQRYAKSKGQLSNERIERLNLIGMVWDATEYQDKLMKEGMEKVWENKYNIAKSYYIKHGDLNVPIGYMINGFNLYNWLKRQRKAYESGTLSNKKHNALSIIGMEW